MKRAIHIQPIPAERAFEIDLPKGAVIRSYTFSYQKKQLSVFSPMQPQREVVTEIPAMLVEFDPSPDHPTETRSFMVAQDDQVIESKDNRELKYIGSAVSQVSRGSVFHLFEEVPDLHERFFKPL